MAHPPAPAPVIRCDDLVSGPAFLDNRTDFLLFNRLQWMLYQGL